MRLRAAVPESTYVDGDTTTNRLYVFELADTVRERHRVPPKRTARPYVYVGYTGRSRRERLNEHRLGRFAADKKWAPHYVRARADLYRLWPTYPTAEEALEAEANLARVLATEGYTVVNKTGRAIQISSGRKTK